MGENIEPFQVFISYCQATGSRFAEHLKNGLEGVGVKSFVDRFDIPNTITEDSDEWRSHIDNAIINSKLFVLIMTLGFNTRPEIRRELKLAIDNKKRRFYCMDKDLPKSQLSIKLENGTHNLSDFQNQPFRDEEDLLRKVGAVLLGGGTEDTISHFDTKASNLISTGGVHFKYENNPLIEIIIGPKSDQENWLPANEENRTLIRNSPFFKNVTTTRQYFYGETLAKDEYYQVYVDGFFHFIKNLYSDSETYYIDSLLMEIIENTIFAARLMKYKEKTADLVLHIRLLNISGRPFQFWGHFQHEIYHFHNENPNYEYKNEINSSSDYSQFKQVFFEIFKEICVDLGITRITDLTINRRLWGIIREIRSIRTHYDTTMRALQITEDFGFSEDEMK